MNDWRQLLRDHYDDPYHRGDCDAPIHAGTADCDESPCQLGCELCVDPSARIVQAWFDGSGCETCEALASVLAGYCEGWSLSELRQLNAEKLQFGLGLTNPDLWNSAPCTWLPWQALQAAITNPLDSDHAHGEIAHGDITSSDLADGPRFGGPSLREEC